MDAIPTAAWAHDQFAAADLGDARRSARLVAIATTVATQPHGTVAEVFRHDAAAREATYRFLENPAIDAHALSVSALAAGARSVAGAAVVYVAVDGATLTLPCRGDFGPVASKSAATGAQVMSALILDEDGVPSGLGAQVYWTRTAARTGSTKNDRRPLAERETRHWLDVITPTAAALATHAPTSLPWFLLDRGGDTVDVLRGLVDLGVGFTVRACYDRRIVGPIHKLGPALAAMPVLGTYDLAVPATASRTARPARIAVRARRVTLRLSRPRRGHAAEALQLTLWAVEAHEVRASVGVEPLCWRLLTNRAVHTFADGLAVVASYARRWRIEDFHFAWKSGVCGIERAQLRSLDHLRTWATILATVAVRAERLKHLARAEPDTPAAIEFSRDEIDAVIALYEPVGVALGADPTLGQLTQWIAELGGYVKYARHPPGTLVLARGLADVAAAARALGAVRRRLPDK